MIINALQKYESNTHLNIYGRGDDRSCGHSTINSDIRSKVGTWTWPKYRVAQKVVEISVVEINQVDGTEGRAWREILLSRYGHIGVLQWYWIAQHFIDA